MAAVVGQAAVAAAVVLVALPDAGLSVLTGRTVPHDGR